jgi:hypothetical protein
MIERHVSRGEVTAMFDGLQVNVMITRERL